MNFFNAKFLPLNYQSFVKQHLFFIFIVFGSLTRYMNITLLKILLPISLLSFPTNKRVQPKIGTCFWLYAHKIYALEKQL